MQLGEGKFFLYVMDYFALGAVTALVVFVIAFVAAKIKEQADNSDPPNSPPPPMDRL